MSTKQPKNVQKLYLYRIKNFIFIKNFVTYSFILKYVGNSVKIKFTKISDKQCRKDYVKKPTITKSRWIKVIITWPSVKGIFPCFRTQLFYVAFCIINISLF